MAHEEEQYDVQGWLMFYSVTRIAIGVLILIVLLIKLPLPHLGLVLLSCVPTISGFIAGFGIVRQANWALSVIGIDMAIHLIFFGVGAYQSGLGSLPVLLGEVVRLAILYAWFEYFRTSKRVHRALGGNLLNPGYEVGTETV